MYKEYFGLRERPFTHGPGERFFAANANVNEALARLRHVLGARDAIAVVSGGPGAGKSAIVEQAISTAAGRARIARVDLRFAEAEDLYAAVLLSLGETVPDAKPVHALHALRETMAHSAQDDRRIVLTLDVGGMTADVARHLLRLVNLSGELGCQMNLLLMGPHPLHQQLDLPALIHLRQRIAFRHRVRPLTLPETDHYVRHQLELAGSAPGEVLSSNVAAAVYCFVAGVPRLINTLLDATLGDACAHAVQRPDGNIVRRTAEALGWKPLAPPQSGAEPARAPPAPRATSPRPAPSAAVAAAASRASAAPDARRALAAAQSPPSGLTMASLAARAETLASVPLASEASSPTATMLGASGEAKDHRGVPDMDPLDPGATGMLRLQDLNDRFAETIFGEK